MRFTVEKRHGAARGGDRALQESRVSTVNRD
jgi:hypothetical protein